MRDRCVDIRGVVGREGDREIVTPQGIGCFCSGNGGLLR